MEVIERIVTQLNAVRLKDGEYRAQCPAHQGKSKRSLAIKEAGDRVLIHCYSGCDYKSIVMALGMKSAAELFLAVRSRFDPEAQRYLRIEKGKRIFDEWCSKYVGVVAKQLRNLERSIEFMAKVLSSFHKGEVVLDAEREREVWEVLSSCYRLRSDLEWDFSILNGTDRDAKIPIYRRVTGAK